MELYKRKYSSPIGEIILSGTQEFILEISFNDQISLQEFDPKENIISLNKAALWLDEYFQGKNPSIDSLPFQTSGTIFQKKVWNRLCRIPFGQTITYGDIAKEIAVEQNIIRMSAQAVGQAVRANPICIVIPCHRVIGSNGQLTGFSAGIEKKKQLLEHEAKYIKQLGLN